MQHAYSRLDPSREQTTLIGLKEQEPVEVLDVPNNINEPIATKMELELTASVIFSTGSIS
jgi:hypothetical protein